MSPGERTLRADRGLPSERGAFDHDVDQYGGYAYTTNDRKSSLHANRRDSNLIIELGRLDGKRVVDVGCGDGTYTAVLRAETDAASILGIDPAGRAIEAASKHADGRLSFRHAVVQELIDAGERFDLAIYRGVLHHTADPEKEVAAMARIANEALILEPNGLNVVLKLIEKYSAYHVAHAERSFTPARMRRWIERAGGELQATRFSGLVPFFCPDWFVPIGSALEPLVPRVPIVRAFACGQYAFRVSFRNPETERDAVPARASANRDPRPRSE